MSRINKLKVIICFLTTNTESTVFVTKSKTVLTKLSFHWGEKTINKIIKSYFIYQNGILNQQEKMSDNCCLMSKMCIFLF